MTLFLIFTPLLERSHHLFSSGYMVFKSLIFAFRIEGQEELNLDVLVFKKHMLFSVSPNNADILLNLARVLFNLQYLDDAIVLTRRSLEVQPPDQNAWAQHFQLGEILKAYCHYQEVRSPCLPFPDVYALQKIYFLNRSN